MIVHSYTKICYLLIRFSIFNYQIKFNHLPGAYRYIDSRKHNDFDYRNKSAIFESPVLKAEGLQNMKFAYSMYGKDISSLKVVFVDQASGEVKIAFEKKGNQGKGPAYSWFDACVQLPATGTYKVTSLFELFFTYILADYWFKILLFLQQL